MLGNRRAKSEKKVYSDKEEQRFILPESEWSFSLKDGSLGFSQNQHNPITSPEKNREILQEHYLRQSSDPFPRLF